ncbi:TIGR04086 family membrane protein [Clostridium rectalis]|uniref:TIGR04086 family membrane protein n=1 Tax=Clostridium rectalis TaxID=2040295 RepID=UPI000F643F3F|nr:TIGR04086 family membrane protein [Clostridium rectalis]
MEKSSFLDIGDGVLRSTIITVVLMIIYAVIMSFIDLTERTNSIFYLVTSIISIMYGSIYAVKRINKKGWLVGVIVAAIYMVIIYIVSIIAGNSAAIESTQITRFLLALAVGLLSGMIGVNL